MDVYLMQHGVALSEDEDAARPLSADGRAGVEKVVRRARSAGIRIDRVLHSGKLRAEQTAQALAAALEVWDVRFQEGLKPADPVQPFAQQLRDSEESGSLAVVGHLPFLDRLASLLVAGDEAAQAVRFQNGGLVKLVPKKDAAGHSVAWVLVPDLA